MKSTNLKILFFSV